MIVSTRFLLLLFLYCLNLWSNGNFCCSNMSNFRISAARSPRSRPNPLSEAAFKNRHYQIDIGKQTLEYKNYLSIVPKDARGKGIQTSLPEPRTPDPEGPSSKRGFDGEIRAWRRLLHKWDVKKQETSPQPHRDSTITIITTTSPSLNLIDPVSEQDEIGKLGEKKKKEKEKTDIQPDLVASIRSWQIHQTNYGVRLAQKTPPDKLQSVLANKGSLTKAAAVEIFKIQNRGLIPPLSTRHLGLGKVETKELPMSTRTLIWTILNMKNNRGLTLPMTPITNPSSPRSPYSPTLSFNSEDEDIVTPISPLSRSLSSESQSLISPQTEQTRGQISPSHHEYIKQIKAISGIPENASWADLTDEEFGTENAS